MNKLPEGWSVKTIGDWGITAESGFPSGKHNSHGDGVIHLRPMNVDRNGQLDLSIIKSVPIDVSGKRISSGDILFNNTNSPELVGKTTFFENSEQLAFSNHMTRLSVPTEKVDAKFVAMKLHLLWRDGFFKQICSNHVNQASISTKRLLNVDLALPSLTTQRQIVQKLEHLLNRLDSAKKSADSAAEKTSSSLGAFLHEIDITSAEKKGWEISTLGDHVEKPQYGWTTSGVSEGTSKLLRTTDIIRADLDWASVPFCENAPPKLDQFKLEEGDIVISRTGAGVGSSRLIENPPAESVFASYLIRIRVKPTLLPEFVAYFLKSPGYWRQISEQKAGSAIPNINVPKIQELRLAIPPLNTQEELVESFKEFETRTLITRTKILSIQDRIEMLRHSLLNSIFSGQLKIGAIDE